MTFRGYWGGEVGMGPELVTDLTLELGLMEYVQPRDVFAPIRWGLEPALTDPSKFQAVDFQIVLPGYFEVLHTALIAGRTFTDADNAPDRKGVVIDQMLAAKAFPGESAIGKRLLIRI